MNSELLIKIRAEVAGFKRSIADVKKELRAMGVSVKDIGTSSSAANKSIKTLGDSSDKSSKGVKTLGDAVTQVNIRFKDMVKGFLAFKAFRVVTGFFTGSVNGARELEEGLIGVSKTTGFAADQIKQYENAIVSLSKEIPVAVSELVEIGVVAGQLGIGSQGVQAVTDFTEVIAKASIALPEFTGGAGQIAETVARASNAFGFGIGSAENYLSVLNALANTTASNAAEITSFNNNFAGTAKNLNISAQEASALGATLVSLGISGDNAGTRVSSAFNLLSNNLEGAAQVAGVSFEDLKSVFEGDFLTGVELVLTSIGGIDSEVEKLTTTSDLFGQIGSRAVLQLIENFDVLDANIETANRAFEENISLQQEFEVAQQSFNAQLQEGANIWEAIRINVGQQILPSLLGGVRDLTSAQKEGASATQVLGGVFVAVFESIRTILLATSTVISSFFKFISTGGEIIGVTLFNTFNGIGTIIEATTNLGKLLFKDFSGTTKAVFADSFNFIIERANDLISTISGIKEFLGFDAIDFKLPPIEIVGSEDAQAEIQAIKDGISSLTTVGSGAGAKIDEASNEIGESFRDLAKNVAEGGDRIFDAFQRDQVGEKAVENSAKISKILAEQGGDIADIAESTYQARKDALDKEIELGNITQEEYDKNISKLKTQIKEEVRLIEKGEKDKNKARNDLLNELGVNSTGVSAVSPIEKEVESTEKSFESLDKAINKTFDQYEKGAERVANAQKKVNDLIADFNEQTDEQSLDLDFSINESIEDRVIELSQRIIEEQEKINDLRSEISSSDDAERTAELNEQLKVSQEQLKVNSELLSRTRDNSGDVDIDSVVSEQNRLSKLSEDEIKQEQFENQQEVFAKRKEILEANTIEELKAIDDVEDRENQKLINTRIEKLETIELEKQSQIQAENELAITRQNIEAQISSQRLLDIQEWGDEYISTLERARSIQNQINNSKIQGSSLPTFHTGGVVQGRGEVPIMALGGEGVLRNAAMNAIGGKQTLDYINKFKALPNISQGSSTTSSITNKNIKNSKTIRGNVIINEAPANSGREFFNDYFGY